MKILIVCESSGTVREAFRALGHDAWSCDLLPADDASPFHYQADARDVGGEWDMMGFHPPCTFLNVAGMHWNNRGRGWDRTNDALQFVRWCMSHRCPWYLENPVSIISTKFRKPDQTIQPYDFGEDASKRTCLWLNDLPQLSPTLRIPGRIATDPNTGKIVERWANQTDSGQNKLTPSADRWKARSKTYVGIANALADQWGRSLTTQMQLI
jgi:hypothetical protein